jgi:hypothetical protein
LTNRSKHFVSMALSVFHVPDAVCVMWRLIAKKQELKQAAMQQLLTRLSGTAYIGIDQMSHGLFHSEKSCGMRYKSLRGRPGGASPRASMAATGAKRSRP